MTSRTIRRGQFYALAAMAIWSTNYILGRSLRDTLTPATISTVRAIMAGIPLATWVGARGEWPHPLRPFLGPFLGLGFLGIFASQYLTYLALHWSLATNVIILNAGSPLVTAALAVAAGVTPFSARLFGGLALSVAGAALVTALGASGGTRVQLDPGALLVVASMVTWGLYNLGVQRLSRSLPPLAITSGSMVAGLPFLLAALWIERPAQVWVSVWRNFPTLVYLALGPSAVAYACWSAAIRDLGAGYAMLFNNTLPVFGMVLGAVILHEPVTIVQVLASALIIGGIMVGFRSLALEVHTPPSGGSPGSRKSVGTPEEGPGRWGRA
jgi:drug/metabolite transporter (DMT)-like permease